MAKGEHVGGGGGWEVLKAKVRRPACGHLGQSCLPTRIHDPAVPEGGRTDSGRAGVLADVSLFRVVGPLCVLVGPAAAIRHSCVKTLPS